VAAAVLMDIGPYMTKW